VRIVGGRVDVLGIIAGVEIHDAGLDVLLEQLFHLLRAVCLKTGHADDLLPDGKRLVAILLRLEQHGGAGHQHRTDQAQGNAHGKDLARVVVRPETHRPRACPPARRQLTWRRILLRILV
jgi:hypothetical protein